MKQFGFSIGERIKSKNDSELVYKNGEVLFSSTQKFKAVFFIRRGHNESGIKTAFAVSSKAGNAVWRNRIKRLMRESFRLKKNEIFPEEVQKEIFLLVVFSPNSINQKNSKKIFLKEVMPEMIELMNLIRVKL